MKARESREFNESRDSIESRGLKESRGLRESRGLKESRGPKESRGTRELTSHSDWFCQSNTFSCLVERDEGEDLNLLLHRQGLSKYIDIFLRHEVDLETFINLTEEELKELGIVTFGKYLLRCANLKCYKNVFKKMFNTLLFTL